MFARATRPDTLTALTVNVDDAETRALVQEWEELNVDIPLKVIESPYREITRPVVDVHQETAAERSTRRGQCLHPRICCRPMVGEPAAQPEFVAAQGPTAVRARRDGHQRAMAAALFGTPRPRPRGTRSRRNSQRHRPFHYRLVKRQQTTDFVHSRRADLTKALYPVLWVAQPYLSRLHAYSHECPRNRAALMTLLKDIPLLGLSFWKLADALRAVEREAATPAA